MGGMLQRPHPLPSLSPIRPNHLLCMFPRSLGKLSPRQHPCHFFSPLFAGNLADGGLGPTAGFALFDYIVVISEGSDLREVGYAEHLIAFGERLQFLSHRLGGATAYAGVDFVED